MFADEVKCYLKTNSSTALECTIFRSVVFEILGPTSLGLFFGVILSISIYCLLLCIERGYCRTVHIDHDQKDTTNNLLETELQV